MFIYSHITPLHAHILHPHMLTYHTLTCSHVPHCSPTPVSLGPAPVPLLLLSQRPRGLSISGDPGAGSADPHRAGGCLCCPHQSKVGVVWWSGMTIVGWCYGEGVGWKLGGGGTVEGVVWWMMYMHSWRCANEMYSLPQWSVWFRVTWSFLLAVWLAFISTLGPDCPLCLRAWSCLDLVFKPLHGGVERTATEVIIDLFRPSTLLPRPLSLKFTPQSSIPMSVDWMIRESREGFNHNWQQ